MYNPGKHFLVTQRAVTLFAWGEVIFITLVVRMVDLLECTRILWDTLQRDALFCAKILFYGIFNELCHFKKDRVRQ